MNSNLLPTFPDGFNVGEVVWARRNHDGIYWPGRITFISNNLTDGLTNYNNLQYQLWSYCIEFLGYNQTNYTVDVLPYRQYRDYMSKNLLVHYDAYPQIKYQFLNAMNQADYVDINESSCSIKSDNSNSFYSYKNNPNHNYIPSSTACQNSIPHTTNEYPLNSYPQYPSNCSYNTQFSSNNYCLCCTQPSFSSTNQLPIETNLNTEYHQPQNDVVSPQTETFQKTNSIIIITTKAYTNPSFISYLFNCLSNFLYHSIIYIDDLTNYQHPTISNISYLICLDNFDPIIQQTLDSTILNNLDAHINYLFLVINTPSNELVRHLYSTIMDKQTILILHYHSTFDNEPLLLCSGNRTIFEMIRSSLLKKLCSKVKYIQSNDDEFIKNEPIIEIPNHTIESNITNEYLTIPSVLKHRKKFKQRKHINNLGKKILKQKLKQRRVKHERISGSSSEYYVQNILDTFNSSK